MAFYSGEGTLKKGARMYGCRDKKGRTWKSVSHVEFFQSVPSASRCFMLIFNLSFQIHIIKILQIVIALIILIMLSSRQPYECNASIYTAIDRAITKTKGRRVHEYVFCSMVFANIYVQGRGKGGVCMCRALKSWLLFQE